MQRRRQIFHSLLLLNITFSADVSGENATTIRRRDE